MGGALGESHCAVPLRKRVVVGEAAFIRTAVLSTYLDARQKDRLPSVIVKSMNLFGGGVEGAGRIVFFAGMKSQASQTPSSVFL